MKMEAVKEIKDDKGTMLAMVVRSGFDKKGISFFTPDEFSQQLAYMHHEKGHEIAPHVHNRVIREIQYTKEILIIRKGKLRCDFYSDDQKYIKSLIVSSGDVLLLASGGHGFQCLEETEMFEIKQGPYSGEMDKTRFDGIESGRLLMEEQD